jgi:hypothetical protein
VDIGGRTLLAGLDAILDSEQMGVKRSVEVGGDRDDHDRRRLVAETMGGAGAADSGHGQEARLDMQPRERLGKQVALYPMPVNCLKRATIGSAVGNNIQSS